MVTASTAPPRQQGNRRQLTGLLLAEVTSTLGSEMTAVALPWLVLITTGSATRTSAVLAAQFAGMAVLGLGGGQLATRLGARTMMLVSDLTRAGLMALVPLLLWAQVWSFPAILLVGLAVGAFFPGYSSAQRLVLADIVGDDEVRLTRAGGLMGSLNETASFAGPAIGGALVALAGAAEVLLLDAASYLCAFLLVALLVGARRTNADADDADAEHDTGVLAGLRYVIGSGPLRRQMLGVGFVEVGWTAMMATLPLLALHDGGGATTAGWLLAAYGGGSVVGGLLAARTRRADGRTTSWALAGLAVSTWMLVVPAPIWVRAAAIAANGVCAGVFFPRFFAALTTRTPAQLRARVMTAVTIGISAPAPLGFLGAGLLAQQTGSLTPSLGLVCAAVTLGALILIRPAAR
jgi:MFS family permease